MRRREFVTLIGNAALTWPLVTRAQRSNVARVAALYLGIADADSFPKELREGLRRLGWAVSPRTCP